MRVSGERNDYYWKLLQAQVQQKRIEEIFKAFNDTGIETILIKGWAAARNYPEPYERLAADVDVAVAPQCYARSEKFLVEQNLAGVDLHEGLRHLDTMPWENLYEAAEDIKIGGATVKILCPEDHLRILSAHWLNDGGADKEKLFDIYYAVKNRPADFDWARCLDGAGAVRRRWTICAIGLAEKYLHLDLHDTPIKAETKDLPAWLIKTVENEWNRNVRLKPLHACLGNAEELIEQLKIRLPPNSVQSTVEMEGKFDDKSRIPYQIGSVLHRIKPSADKISKTLLNSARAMRSKK